MTVKKKIMISIIIAGSLILASLFVWRVVAINLKYPASTLKSYEMGETINYLNIFEIMVMDAEFLSDEKAQELFDVENNFKDFEQEYLVTTLNIRNISGETQRFSPSDLTFQSGAFFNGIMLHFMEQLNGWRDMPELKPGEEITIKVPVNIPKSRFRDSQWETVTEREFEIVIALYPEKQVLKLQ